MSNKGSVWLVGSNNSQKNNSWLAVAPTKEEALSTMKRLKGATQVKEATWK